MYKNTIPTIVHEIKYHSPPDKWPDKSHSGQLQEIATPAGIMWQKLYLVQHREQIIAM